MADGPKIVGLVWGLEMWCHVKARWLVIYYQLWGGGINVWFSLRKKLAAEFWQMHTLMSNSGRLNQKSNTCHENFRKNWKMLEKKRFERSPLLSIWLFFWPIIHILAVIELEIKWEVYLKPTYHKKLASLKNIDIRPSYRPKTMKFGGCAHIWA